MTAPHISFELLADLAEGQLTPEEREAPVAHLNDCATCARVLAHLNEMIDLMRTDTAEDAPNDAIKKALELFRARSKAIPFVRQIVASLNFDSMSLSPAFGVRSGMTTSRQLLFSAGENDLDLRITAVNETCVVSGQVLGQCAGGRVRLESAGGEGAATAELNELCEFTLPQVPQGSYRLRLYLTDVEIEVPELEIRA